MDHDCMESMTTIRIYGETKSLFDRIYVCSTCGKAYMNGEKPSQTHICHSFDLLEITEHRTVVHESSAHDLIGVYRCTECGALWKILTRNSVRRPKFVLVRAGGEKPSHGLSFPLDEAEMYANAESKEITTGFQPIVWRPLPRKAVKLNTLPPEMECQPDIRQGFSD